MGIKVVLRCQNLPGKLSGRASQGAWEGGLTLLRYIGSPTIYFSLNLHLLSIPAPLKSMESCSSRC